MAPPGRQPRYFSGICSRFSEGDRSGKTTMYRAELVPAFWLLTKTRDRRIFQDKSVPEILRSVLGGLDADYRLQGSYEPRNYCVQYRESDFGFASRLMEEEGSSTTSNTRRAVTSSCSGTPRPPTRTFRESAR
jgi:type VI secretion system secreted protein VgrG